MRSSSLPRLGRKSTAVAEHGSFSVWEDRVFLRLDQAVERIISGHRSRI